MQLIEQYKIMHKNEGTFAGTSLLPHLDRIYTLVKKYQCKSLLDYGCGKGVLYKHQEQPIVLESGVSGHSVTELLGVSACLYDPAYLPYAIKPSARFDIVICTDVLEHIPELEVPGVIEDLFNYAKDCLYVSISTRTAKKTLPNGENAHCTVKPASWWMDQFDRQIHRRVEVVVNFPDIV